MQLPDWFFDPTFLTGLLFGLIGAISGIISLYTIIKERKIQSLRTTTELLTEKKEEFIEAISQKMKSKYLVSELVATEDSIRDLTIRRNKTIKELQKINLPIKSSLSQNEIVQLEKILRARVPSASEKRGLALLTDISPIALVLAIGSFLSILNFFVLPILIFQKLAEERKRRREIARTLESLST